VKEGGKTKKERIPHQLHRHMYLMRGGAPRFPFLYSPPSFSPHLLITLFSPPSLSEREGGVEKRVISKWGKKEEGKKRGEGAGGNVILPF